MTYTVSLSHQTWAGARKYQAKTIEEAKKKGDAELTDDALHVKGRGASYRIDVVDDKTGLIVATRPINGIWQDTGAPGGEWPKMVWPTGKSRDYAGVIVHSRDEEERVMGITPAAEPEPATTKRRSASK